MNIQFTGQNIEITEALRGYATKRLKKIEKFFNEDVACRIMMKVQKDYQTIEITINQKALTFRSEVTTRDMYKSIDEAIDILVSQITRQKSKLKKMNLDMSFPELLDADLEKEENNNKIVKRKTLELSPMYEEEAIMQMELLGHDMFIFLDANEDLAKVLYKRKDGQYGIISIV